MVTDVYAHTHDDVRKNLARKVEEDFFRTGRHETGSALDPSVSSFVPSDPSVSVAYQLLQDNPQLANLIIAAAQVSTTK